MRNHECQLADELAAGLADEVAHWRDGGAQMQGSGSDSLAVNQWLEEAWRHGELVADREGGPRRAAPRGPTAPARMRGHVRRLLRSVWIPGRLRQW